MNYFLTWNILIRVLLTKILTQSFLSKIVLPKYIVIKIAAMNLTTGSPLYILVLLRFFQYVTISSSDYQTMVVLETYLLLVPLLHSNYFRTMIAALF